MDIILASTSLYRQQLLQRLQIPFSCEPPKTDESPQPGEPPEAMSERLALAKAQAVAGKHPNSLVIGSDQVASINGNTMGKPKNHETARDQLRASSGNTVVFWTSVALICKSSGLCRTVVEHYSVSFRVLSDTEIEGYLQREQPYDCAGSFKCEGLGVALFETMAGDDPTGLEGLPLIATSKLLREAGVNFFPASTRAQATQAASQ